MLLVKLNDLCLFFICKWSFVNPVQMQRIAFSHLLLGKRAKMIPNNRVPVNYTCISLCCDCLHELVIHCRCPKSVGLPFSLFTSFFYAARLWFSFFDLVMPIFVDGLFSSGFACRGLVHLCFGFDIWPQIRRFCYHGIGGIGAGFKKQAEAA